MIGKTFGTESTRLEIEESVVVELEPVQALALALACFFALTVYALILSIVAAITIAERFL